MRLLIDGAQVLTFDPALGDLPEGRVGIEGQQVAFVLPAGAPLPAGWTPQRTLDGHGHILMPGLVNGHTHVPMTLLRGFAGDLPLHEWLFDHIFPAEDKLTGEDVYWGALLGIAEMLRAGITAFADMYYFEQDIGRAVLESGIRAALARGLVEAAAPANLADTRSLAAEWHGAGEGRITTMVAAHAVYTCPPAFLSQIVELATELDLPIHIHLSETTREVEEALAQYGKTPVEIARDAGVFTRHTLVAHAVDLREGDFDILASMRGAVVHNPQSNQKLASGFAPVARLLARGITVGMGTDGASSANTYDLFEATRWAGYAQKALQKDPSYLPARSLMEMAVRGGAVALNLATQVGRVAPGYQADLILVGLDRPHLIPSYDPYSTLAYTVRAGDVETVLVAGRVVMEKRALLTIDEERVFAEVRRRVAKFHA